MVADSTMLCTTVIEAIAKTEGRGSTELEYSLYEYIDPEILDKLENRSANEWELEFRVADHTVTVQGDGALTVDDQDFVWNNE